MTQVTDHYQSGYHRELFNPLIEDERLYRTKALSAERAYFGPFTKPYGQVLEYGCGIGYNIACIDGAVGYDVSRVALAYCEQFGIKTVDRADDICTGHFDYILCRHVLEHVERPLDLLSDLFSYLKDDGVLILVLPKERHRTVPLERDIHRHLYCWTFQTINNAIFAAGGHPVSNSYGPTFGPRTHRLLSPLLGTLGHAPYYHAGRVVGRCLGFIELIIHARRTLN